MIGTYRDEELSPNHPLYRLVPVLVRETNAMRVKLGRFDRVDTGELIQARYRLAGDDLERLLVYLQSRSEGNPFFIDELLLSLEDEGLLRAGDSGWVLDDLAGAPLPSLVRQVVDSRLRKLGDETRRLLSFGAVIGESIPVDLWRCLMELSDDEFVRQVGPAIEHRILVEGRPGDRLQFSHALIQAALYESVVLPQRSLWHRAVGEALAATHAPDPSLVADHFRRAGDPRAVEWLIRAGRRAQRLYAWRIAVDRFEDAMSLLERDDRRLVERGWLCHRLGRVLCFRDPARSRYYLDRAIEISDEAGDELLNACAVTERGHRHGLDGDYRSALDLMARGLAAFDQLLDQQVVPSEGQPTPESLKRAMDELRGKRIIWVAGIESFDNAMHLALDALTRLQDDEASDGSDESITSSATGTANVYTALGLCYAVLGQVDRARDAFARASRLHRNPFARGLTIDTEAVLVTRAYLLDQPWLLDEQVREGSFCLTTSVEAGIASGEAYSFAGAVLSLTRGIDWPQTMHVLERARSSEIDAVWRNQASGFLGELARRRGRPDLAWAEVQSVLPQGAMSDPRDRQFFGNVEIPVLAVDLALDEGNLVLARAWLDCHDRWVEHFGTVYGKLQRELLWARYYRLDGDADRARRHAEQALAIASEPRQPLDLLAVHRLLGVLDLEAERYVEAEAHLTASLELADACLARHERALTLLVLARLCVTTARESEATTHLSEVRSICTPLDARPALVEADEIATMIDRSHGSPSHQTDLTARELEVLRLVARGLTDAEVADELFISPRTVGTHLTSIYSKLNVRSRTEATRFAVENNLA